VFSFAPVWLYDILPNTLLSTLNIQHLLKPSRTTSTGNRFVLLTGASVGAAASLRVTRHRFYPTRFVSSRISTLPLFSPVSASVRAWVLFRMLACWRIKNPVFCGSAALALSALAWPRDLPCSVLISEYMRKVSSERAVFSYGATATRR
jgi:hypothetical protein